MSGKARITSAEAYKRADKEIAKAVDMSFPASDPTVRGQQTPSRPQDREAPMITKEQIEQAQKGAGHKQRGGR
jgi:hypothetical protein